MRHRLTIGRIFFHWDTILPRWVKKILFIAIAGLLFFLAYQIWSEYAQTYQHIPFTIQSNWPIVFSAIIFLSCCNWLIEALKWKLYVDKTNRIPFAVAAKAILFGISLGAVSPNRIGDYSGRSLFLPENARRQGASATFFCSTAQNIATFLLGGIACVLASEKLSISYGPTVLIIGWASILASAVFASLLFASKWYSRIAKKLNAEKINTYLQNISERYPFGTNSMVLFLSIGRYCIFITQFYLLLNLFADVPFMQSYIGIGTTYVVNTLLPSNQLIEFGVRTSIPMFVLKGYGIAPEISVLASLLLWFFNLGFPAFLGLFIHTTQRKG